jgi:hypothetical protein
MRPTSVTVSSQTTSAWIPVDYRQAPFNVSIAVVVAGGSTLTYSVQHTFDDIFDSSVTPTAWDASDANLVAETASQDGAITSPVRAVRLNVTAFTAGSATMTVLQGGSA